MSEIAIAENSAALLDAALNAASGLERWRQHSFLAAHLSQAGGLWGMKGQAGVLDDVRVDVALHQEWAAHHPFGAPELRSSFTPRRVEIRDGDGTAVEALDDPRPSFSAHAFDTPVDAPTAHLLRGKRNVDTPHPTVLPHPSRLPRRLSRKAVRNSLYR